MTALKSATELAVAASKPYPNDSAAYREARTTLLAEETVQAPHRARRGPRRAAARREVVREFIDEAGAVRLVDLFGKHDTLVIYFWMYGPERERPCPMCTSFSAVGGPRVRYLQRALSR